MWWSGAKRSKGGWTAKAAWGGGIAATNSERVISQADANELKNMIQEAETAIKSWKLSSLEISDLKDWIKEAKAELSNAKIAKETPKAKPKAEKPKAETPKGNDSRDFNSKESRDYFSSLVDKYGYDKANRMFSGK